MQVCTAGRGEPIRNSTRISSIGPGSTTPSCSPPPWRSQSCTSLSWNACRSRGPCSQRRLMSCSGSVSSHHLPCIGSGHDLGATQVGPRHLSHPKSPRRIRGLILLQKIPLITSLRYSVGNMARMKWRGLAGFIFPAGVIPPLWGILLTSTSSSVRECLQHAAPAPFSSWRWSLGEPVVAHCHDDGKRGNYFEEVNDGLHCMLLT